MLFRPGFFLAMTIPSLTKTSRTSLHSATLVNSYSFSMFILDQLQVPMSAFVYPRHGFRTTSLSVLPEGSSIVPTSNALFMHQFPIISLAYPVAELITCYILKDVVTVLAHQRSLGRAEERFEHPMPTSNSPQ